MESSNGVLLVSLTKVSPHQMLHNWLTKRGSAPPGDRETRDRAQRVRLLLEQIKVPDRLLGQEARLVARALHAQERDEIRLAGGAVLTGRLAGRRGVALGVDEVVGDLEGEAEIVRIGPERLSRRLSRMPQHRPRLAGAGDQRPGLQALQARDL